MATIKKYHASRINALHFLKIAYRKLRCSNPYKKLGRTNLIYDWFIDKRKIKIKYVHVNKLGTQVETRKQNLPILENHPILRYSIVTMLQKMREANQLLATSIVQPIICGMIESLAFDVLYDNKAGGFKVIQEWTL
jgi:hypothetical protein